MRLVECRQIVYWLSDSNRFVVGWSILLCSAALPLSMILLPNGSIFLSEASKVRCCYDVPDGSSIQPDRP